MDAEEYLLKLPLWAKKKNTLEDLRLFLAELGHPDRDMRLIHVAGTNGKGSVCAYMTAELLRLGLRAGTFISPHLGHISERLLLNGQPIGKTAFQEIFEEIRHLTDRMTERGYLQPTFFEYLFLMAMVWYRDNPVDYLILEAGLGGRLDTTNVIELPVLTLITSISLDHMQYLGNTIGEIAAEKAGIIKTGCPVVYDDNQPLASAVIQMQAKAAGAAAWPVKRPQAAGEGFRAPYLAMNACLVCKGLSLLNLPGWNRSEAFDRLRSFVWSGRMEEVRPGIWLDGAHNEAGAKAFAEAARQIVKIEKKRVHILFAAVADKDYRSMIAHICHGLLPARVTVARLREERTADSRGLEEEFRKCLPKAEICPFPNSREALCDALKKKTKDDILFVVGSLYLIGEVKTIMEEQDVKF